MAARLEVRLEALLEASTRRTAYAELKLETAKDLVVYTSQLMMETVRLLTFIQTRQAATAEVALTENSGFIRVL